MNKYRVKGTLTVTFFKVVEANSPEEAEEVITDMEPSDLLDHADGEELDVDFPELALEQKG